MHRRGDHSAIEHGPHAAILPISGTRRSQPRQDAHSRIPYRSNADSACTCPQRAQRFTAPSCCCQARTRACSSRLSGSRMPAAFGHRPAALLGYALALLVRIVGLTLNGGAKAAECADHRPQRRTATSAGVPERRTRLLAAPWTQMPTWPAFSEAIERAATHRAGPNGDRERCRPRPGAHAGLRFARFGRPSTVRSQSSPHRWRIRPLTRDAKPRLRCIVAPLVSFLSRGRLKTSPISLLREIGLFLLAE